MAGSGRDDPRHLRQDVGHAVDARATLVVGIDDVPRSLGEIRVHEHVVLRARVVHPLRPGEQVGLGELPAAHRIVDPFAEPPLLFFVGHREPVLQQDDAVFHEEPLEDRALPEEQLVVLRRAEPEHALHTGAVVPGPVEQGDLAAGRQVRDVALEVPLGLLALRGLGQRDVLRDARVHVLGHALDRAALARPRRAPRTRSRSGRPSRRPTPPSSRAPLGGEPVRARTPSCAASRPWVASLGRTPFPRRVPGRTLPAI